MGGVAAVAVLIIGMMAMGGGRSTPAKPKEASLQPPETHDAPMPQRTLPPVQRNEQRTDTKPNADPIGLALGDKTDKRATDAFEQAKKLAESQPDDFARVLAAYDEVAALAEKTPLNDEVKAARKELTDKWSESIDAALKKMAEDAEPALKKNDYAAAAAALDGDKLPAKLKAEDWQARLDAARKPAADAAEAAAAKLLTDAHLKAGGGDVENLEKAVTLAMKAEAIPATLAPSAAKAAHLRETWTAKIADLKKNENQIRSTQLAAAREKLAPVIKKTMQLMKDSSFSAATDYIEKQRVDAAFSDVKSVIKKEKDDLQAVSALRQAALEILRKKAGEKVKLHQRKDVFTATVKENANTSLVSLQMAQGGSTDLTAEQLDPQDVLSLVAPKEDNSDLKQRAFLYMSCGDTAKARETFQAARDAGQTDAVMLYVDYFEAADAAEQENAAKKALADADKLWDSKKQKDAREAYADFVKTYAKSKALADRADQIKERMKEPEAAVATQTAGPGAWGVYTSTAPAGLVQRPDAKIDFNWDAAPAQGISPDAFSVTWTGLLKIERSGTYNMSIVVGSGNCTGSLTINGKSVLTADFSGTKRTERKEVDLDEGSHPFTMTYTQSKGPGACTLKYSLTGANGFGDRIVPSEILSHDPKAEGKPDEKEKKEIKAGAVGEYLSDMDETNVKMSFGKFGRNGDLTIENRRIRVANVEYPKGLYMRPASRGSSSVTYVLNKKYSQLKTGVAIDDFSVGTLSAMTFKLIGDGKVLWTSAPLTRPGRKEDAVVDVSGVTKLEVRVEAKDAAQDAHCVWLDPQVFK